MIRKFTGKFFNALVLVLVLSLALPWAAFADGITNNIDTTVDAALESMTLSTVGATGTTTFKVVVNDNSTDPNNGCNLAGNTTSMTATVSSSDPTVASVNPTEITFDSCDVNSAVVTVTAHKGGTATISLSEKSRTASVEGTFNFTPAAFTVTVTAPTRANTSLAVAAASGTYGGSTQLSATLTKSSDGSAVSGKSVAFTLNGASVGSEITNASGVATLSASLGTIGAGPYASGVGASFAQDDTHNGTNGSGSLTVNKAQASISLSNLSYVYDGTAKAATATTSPSGLSGVLISYSQSSQTVASPTNAGSYKVTASLNNPNYTAQDATDELVIAKKGVTVQLSGDLNPTYDGQPHSLTASTTPSGLNVSVTYGSSATAPTNAGSYKVVATVNEDNYSGSDEKTLVIGKAAGSISWGTLPAPTYGPNGTFTVSASANSGATVSFARVSGPCALVSGGQFNISGAGDCVISASALATDNYSIASSEETVRIAKANQIISFPAIDDKTYGDGDFDPAASASSGLAVSYAASDNCSIVSGKVQITGAGSCTVTASQAGNDNYNVAASKYQTFQIAKATPVLNWSAPTAITYGTALGNTQLNATASFKSSSVAGTFDYTPAAGTVLSAGDNQALSVTFTPTDSTNFNSTSERVSINVQKANQEIMFATITGKTFGNADFQAIAPGGASGNAVTFAVKAESNSKCTVTSAGMVTIIGAGSCTLVASQAGNNNYNAAPDAVQTFSIAKAQARVTLSNLSHIYDGTAKAATAVTTPASLNVDITYNGSAAAPSAVGTYSVVATVNDANYQGSAMDNLVIGAWTTTGFYSPVDMSGIVNTVKAGSTVPAKFEVFKGTTELKDVSAVKSTTYKTVSCTSLSATSDEIETLASGSTSLRFDATADQFIYNWKTPSAGCYQLIVTTQDGSQLTAYFKTR